MRLLKRMIGIVACLLFVTFTIQPAFAQNVYYISDVSGILQMQDDPDGEYHLTRNIVINEDVGILFPSEETPFTGVLNGHGNSIVGYYLESNAEAVGFFGVSRGVIKNITFSDCHVVSHRVDAEAGVIVGRNFGELLSCQVIGSVNINGEYKECDGIYGYNLGEVINCFEDLSMRPSRGNGNNSPSSGFSFAVSSSDLSVSSGVSSLNNSSVASKHSLTVTSEKASSQTIISNSQDITSDKPQSVTESVFASSLEQPSDPQTSSEDFVLSTTAKKTENDKVMDTFVFVLCCVGLATLFGFVISRDIRNRLLEKEKSQKESDEK